MHISSSYAKILGQKLFRTREVPRSGSKAKNGEREKERLNDGDNNGQATHGARKHAWRTQAAWAKRGEKERLNNGQAMHGARKHAWRTQAARDKITFLGTPEVGEKQYMEKERREKYSRG